MSEKKPFNPYLTTDSPIRLKRSWNETDEDSDDSLIDLTESPFKITQKKACARVETDEDSDDSAIDLTETPFKSTQQKTCTGVVSPEQGQMTFNGKQLHEKQVQAVEAAKRGEDIFITGPGGTGKSEVMRCIISHLNSEYSSDEWTVVAPTGIAAIALDGQTIHSFAGCGVPQLVTDFGRCWEKNFRKRWRRLRVLLIDEISMLSGEFLDHLGNVVNNIRKYQNPHEVEPDFDRLAPFTGIQLIFCGDFLQLPPIAKKIQDIKAILSSKKYKLHDIHRDQGFAFESNLWKRRNLKVIQLHHIFRQDNKDFQDILSEIRLGEVSSQSEQFLQRCNRPLPKMNGIKPTILYPRNTDVSEENRQELARLPGMRCVYHAEDDTYVCADAKEGASEILANHSFFNDCIAERKLHLKTDAQVMLTKNEPGSYHSLANGCRGVVIGFAREDKCKRGENDRLRLSCAEDLVSDNIDGSLLPVVEFLHHGVVKVVEIEDFTLELSGVGTCVRKATPLKLAWAITVHKAQGMSIDYVRADVTKVFTYAQTYVALSRATDENGLELRGFEPKKVTANKKALAFYDNPISSFPPWDEASNQAEEAMGESDKDIKIDIPSAKAGCLEGLLFVFTGEPSHITRTEAEHLVKTCGGALRSSVSGKTHYLVIGNTMEDGRDITSGNKYTKAKEVVAGKNPSDLKILNELELFELIKNPPPPKKKQKSISSFFGKK